LLDKARRGGIDIYFEGDSITRRWGAGDYPDLLNNWTQNLFGWNAANFGRSSSCSPARTTSAAPSRPGTYRPPWRTSLEGSCRVSA
jgi:hypothetical protein